MDNDTNQLNNTNNGLPQQGIAPQQNVEGIAVPNPATDGVNDVNVQQQDAGLIDDVTNGNFTNVTNDQPINSLDDASNAFLRMLQGGGEGTADAQTEPAAQPDEGVTDGQAATGETSSDSEGEPAPITESNTTPTATEGINESQIQSMINDAIQREIQNGNLQDLSAQDMTAQLGGDNQQKTLESAANDGQQGEPDIDINSDEFFEMFTENPTEAIDKLTNARVRQELAPILKELEPLLEQSKKAQENKNILDTVKAFGNEYPDFKDYNDDMIKILNEGDFPKNDINSYRNAYQTAKNNRLASQVEQLQNQLAESEQNRGKSLNDYLGDSDSFNSLRNNEDLKKAIIEDYIKDLSKGGTPQMISSGGSAQPSAMPADKVNDFREASEKFKMMLQN